MADELNAYHVPALSLCPISRWQHSGNRLYRWIRGINLGFDGYSQAILVKGQDMTDFKLACFLYSVSGYRNNESGTLFKEMMADTGDE